MYRCIFNRDGEMLGHRHMPAGPEPCLKTLAPYRTDLVVCVEGLFPWYGLADRCAREGMPCVLGHALAMKAIHGAKPNTTRAMPTKSPGCGAVGGDPRPLSIPRRGGRLVICGGAAGL
jgi:hypothetical protein